MDSLPLQRTLAVLRGTGALVPRGVYRFATFDDAGRVDDPNAGAYAREPQAEDVARICQALNAEGARYVLIGGFAVIAHGGVRTTKDIDLLIDPRPENVADNYRDR